MNPNVAAQHGVCAACGSPSHSSSRSRECPLHRLTIEEVIKIKYGNNAERFSRKIPLDNVVRPEFMPVLQNKIISLSSFLRNVIVRMQLFVNAYIIEHGQTAVPTYVYSQSFWYSVSQLVMDIGISNDNPNMPDVIVEYWNIFRRRHPNIVFPRNNFSGYSDALSAACKTLRDTYATDIVENFQSRVCKFIVHRLQILVPVSFSSQ